MALFEELRCGDTLALMASLYGLSLVQEKVDTHRLWYGCILALMASGYVLPLRQNCVRIALQTKDELGYETFTMPCAVPLSLGGPGNLPGYVVEWVNRGPDSA